MIIENIVLFMQKVMLFTSYINNQSSFPKPLSADEEKELLVSVEKGDVESKNELINRNLRLVAHIVKKFKQSEECDDLISVGCLGLIKAINTYKLNHGTQFSTYAARCIENEILMLLRANKKYKNDVSLSDPVGTDKDGNELTLMDLLSEKEDSVFKHVDKSIERDKFLNFIKEHLTSREYTVLCLRYGLKGERNYAQREVARFLKISRSYISRIEKKAIDKLKLAVKKGQFYC
jgi:RNA polymerase sporulation-specific sigma factor